MGDIADLFASDVGSILLALLAGAGGSALLELIWRPRRAKLRAARLLNAEVAQNTQLLALTAAMMDLNPLRVGPGFRVSRLVWDASVEAVPELPEDVLREVIALYGSYEEINRDAQAIEALLASSDHVSGDPFLLERVNGRVLEALSVFGEEVARATDRGRVVSRELRKVLGANGEDPTIKPKEEYQRRAAALVAQRTQRIQRAGESSPD